jgi:hypothetical protein
VGQQVVLRVDLQDFFPSISHARVSAIFHTAGYPDSVAHLLASLTTNAAPDDMWDDIDQPGFRDEIRRVRYFYAQPHLPQGAPTSPALANLAAYRLDCRLTGLARVVRAQYTRYADDLAFSGGQEFARIVRRFYGHVCCIAMEEGFRVHFHKTRMMTRGGCQRLAGVIVNDHMNTSRQEYDKLKAILTNCARHGPESQNRVGHRDFRAHLLGSISYITSINPHRGEKLRTLFDRIEWTRNPQPPGSDVPNSELA